MSGLTSLALAMGLFVISHLLLASPVIRALLVDSIGEPLFRVLYSAVAVVLIIWIGRAYASAPVIDLWYPPTALRHLSLSLMPFACVLLVAGVSTPNPSALTGNARRSAVRGPVGITKLTRHPVMWAIGLWGILHLLANGDAAGITLFGGMTLLALGGTATQEQKKRRLLGPAWDAFARETSYLPFVALLQGRTRMTVRDIGYARIGGGIALYLVLLLSHRGLFGVNPLMVG